MKIQPVFIQSIKFLWKQEQQTTRKVVLFLFLLLLQYLNEFLNFEGGLTDGWELLHEFLCFIPMLTKQENG